MNIDDYSITMPGRIVEYFPETQTATVKISNDRTYSTDTDDESQVTPSFLYDVPVFTSGGGFWHITFPIKTDDPCLLSFSQFGYDHWLFKNEDSAGVRDDGHPQAWTEREFDLADGFAQVGWNNIPTAIADYHATDAEFRNVDRDQRIALQENGDIHIKTGTTTITMNPSGDITINTDTNITANVGGNMTANVTGDMTNIVGGNMTSNVTGDSTTTCVNSTVTASASALISTPAATIDAPLTTITGNLLIGGAIGAGGAGIPAGGGSVFSGPMETDNTITTSDVITGSNVVSGGKSVNGHTHSNPEGGSTGPF